MPTVRVKQPCLHCHTQQWVLVAVAADAICATRCLWAVIRLENIVYIHQPLPRQAGITTPAVLAHKDRVYPQTFPQSRFPLQGRPSAGSTQRHLCIAGNIHPPSVLVPDALNRQPFSKEEIQTVWNWSNSNEYASIILMLIYSGVRISELLNLKKENVNLNEKWFDVTASKTKSGIRRVPIADKALPLFKHWMEKNDCQYLLSNPAGKQFDYRNYYDSYWMPLIEQMGMDHRPHDTRHTCISLLAVAGVQDKIIKKIVGHKGQSVTEAVYTHFDIEQLLDAINKI